ncbi:malonyl-CoA decarboxylase [Salinarimonas rosea]|uniref:malonyl-CoA decarboxylase n=1 Tax=Salinarimonas rosea TaxID=552063 RepID=UPI000417733C|nr:malonyl-CoA decarboxylase [Salinarimonas rosea]
MAGGTISFFTDMLQGIAERGRSLVSGGRAEPRSAPALAALAEELLSGAGEATSVARAGDLLAAYAGAPLEVRRGFLGLLASRFGPVEERIAHAIEAYAQAPGPRMAMALHLAAEPRRQELFRKLNRAPGGTLALVRMREDVLAAMPDEPALADVDADFRHLFASWFNRGFLTLRRIDWTSPANVLEKIVAYEAVHRIENLEDLKGRLAPSDRRLYAFFHPALADEPLIFVEVALGREIPGAIAPVLAVGRTPLAADAATTAAFYAISNCQKGLAGVSFGSFLIKQVVEELRRDLPGLRTFATLSPVPGFAAWLAARLADPADPALTREERALLAERWHDGFERDEAAREALREPLRAACATYLARARGPSGKPLDPVARFHLGNGARLERVHALADLSPRGLAQAAGTMVNYLYDLDSIERNHEAYAERGEVALSGEVRRLAKPARVVAGSSPAEPAAVPG